MRIFLLNVKEYKYINKITEYPYDIIYGLCNNNKNTPNIIRSLCFIDLNKIKNRDA